MDLCLRSILPDAFSRAPMEFLPREAQIQLSNISAIELIENGDRSARETWQRAQLGNLLSHAARTSGWWRARIEAAQDGFKSLPAQSRSDVARQTALDGPLGVAGGAAKASYATTGSTGTPVRVYTTEANGAYNVRRSLAQYFIYGLPLSENRVQINPALNLKAMVEPISVRSTDHWAGSLAKFFVNGCNREIIHSYADGATDSLVAALLERPVGYLVCSSRFAEMIYDFGGADLLGRLGLRAWVHTSDLQSPDIVQCLASQGIPSHSVYSSGEVGPIAYECDKHPGHFHVAHSNVIVEADPTLTAQFQGQTVSRLLITGLHSYATPIIRYDVGDFSCVHPACPCGHDGTTLSSIYGRGKSFVRRPDGQFIPFYLSTRALLRAADFTECRVRQHSIDTLTVEIGGRQALDPVEVDNLTRLVVAATDPAFRVEVVAQERLDWANDAKRLFFACKLPDPPT